jgi:hypothetical protein
MSKRTFGCAACAALLFLVAAGPAGAEGHTKEAEPIPERSPSVAVAVAAGTRADAGSTDPAVKVAAGPVVQVVKRDLLGRTISTYYCRTLSVARVHRTFLGFVAFKFWQRKRWCWSYPRILSREVTTYVTDVDPNYQYGGVVASWGAWYIWCCGTQYSGHSSFREARFANCVLKIGCVGEYYPWVRINSRADGSYAYATGS